MADADHVLNLAAIIREVDGTHSKGAAALAESILDHPRFRAVLADEPAAPKSREWPSDEELLDLHDWMADEWAANHDAELPLSQYARAVLARWGHQPAPPADGEVAELAAALRNDAINCTCSTLTSADLRRAAELLQRQALVPVAVSGRPPGPEDCDAEGRCWWGRDESDDWYADWTLATHKAVAEFCGFSPQTVWLPAHALPLPEVGE